MAMEPAPVKDDIFSGKGIMATSWLKWFAKLYDLLNALYTGQTTQVSAAPYPGAVTTRAFGNVYQNTTGKPMFVTVVGKSSAAAVFEAYSDSANPPTIKAWYQYEGTVSTELTAFFVVLPNHYYKLSFTAGTPTLIEWVEKY